MSLIPKRSCFMLASVLLAAAAVAAQDIRLDGPEQKATETDEAVIEQQVKEIKEEYEAISSNQDLEQTRRRRELARRLGRLPHPDSVKVLHRILEGDADLRARIFAMNSVARVGDLAAVKRAYKTVLKESRRTVLDDYFGPALARSTDPAVGPWIVRKPLRQSNKLIRLSAIEALGALGTPEAREPLLALLEKEGRRARRDIHTYFELLRALGRIGGDKTFAVLEKAARDEDWRVRLAVAEVLYIHHRTPKAVALMRELLEDEKPIVRETAAIAAGEHRIEPLFSGLIRLMREGNLRAKREAHDAMTKIAGRDLGYAPDLWAQWLAEKKRGNLTKTGEFKDRERISVATYYNFKIYSDRVLFVIDVSGSMNWPDFHPNRIEVATRELRKAINALDEKTLFNLATFAGHVNMWQKKGEVPATEENRRRALEWVEKNFLPRGATNTYDALIKGLELNPLVDTVFFLSDGIPSTGKYEIPEEILIKLRYANRFRRVIFNTVAIAIGKPSIDKAAKYEDPEEMAAFMRMLAEWNGGTCVDIRKPFLDLRDPD